MVGPRYASFLQVDKSASERWAAGYGAEVTHEPFGGESRDFFRACPAR